MNWPEVNFETIYATPSRNGIYKPKEFHGSGCRMVNMGELFGYDFLGTQEMERVELTDPEIELSGLIDGDLLFGRRSLVEAGAGKCSIIIEPMEPLSFESSIIRVRLDREKVNPRFYYYYFSSPKGRGSICSIVTGTNVKGIRGSDLKELKVLFPPIVEQNLITSTLSAYDDLIENNRRRMALLEETARQLYQEWFLRLRFPGHEHTRIVDGAPEGWKCITIRDICTEIRDTVLPGDLDPDTPYIGLEHMPRRSISLTEWATASAVTSTKHRYKVGDVLFGKIRPYFHKVGIAFTDGVASSDSIVIRPNSEDLRSLVLMTVSSDEFVAEASQTMREGSKMPRADWKLMTRYSIKIPNQSLLRTFTENVAAITDQLGILCFQNRKLREARDLLLPRLMNGELAA